jgi:hypothetical protein
VQTRLPLLLILRIARNRFIYDVCHVKLKFFDQGSFLSKLAYSSTFVDL